MNAIREELKVKEAIKEAEAKRKGTILKSLATLTLTAAWLYHIEKIEDAKARAAIKAQIEADKKARAEKAAREKALREGRPFPDSGAAAPAPAATAPSTSTASGVAGKDYPQTRLQIRLGSGQPYTTTLSSDARKCY